MIDLFISSDMNALLKDKSIVFMGDSNTRALYKDFLCLLTKTKLIPDFVLKRKMENSVFNDKLTSHGLKTNSRDYREEREASINQTYLRFYFLTRVYDDYVEEVLKKVTSKWKPDVLILNSCLWDVTRWGCTGVENYKQNLQKLLKILQKILPDCLIIWVTTPPISSEMRGGFLMQEIEFLKYSLRFHVVEANHYARKVVVEHGFDVVDSHYHLKMQIHRRTGDGIHWYPPAVRYITNLLLTHISLSFNIPLPHRYKSAVMEESLEALIDGEVSTVAPEEETKELNHQQQKLVVAVSSPVKIAEKNNKENCDTPKHNPKRKRKRPGKKAKAQYNESHHGYMNKVQDAERHKRIRQWQTTVPATHTPPSFAEYSAEPSPANKNFNSPVQQHDSGYLSPVRAPQSIHSNRFVIFPSPSQIPLPTEPYPYECNSRQILNSPAHPGLFRFGQPLLPSKPYLYEQPPLLPDPYPFPPRVNFGNRGPFLRSPYAFPHVMQGQILQPKLDFTSNDFEAF